jgi:LmbE family N-acetylglucosaminyl deacetylase
MIGLESDRSQPLRLLCLGAHCDDIEIGAGGTILRLLAERPGTVVRWVVFTGTPQRQAEAGTGARLFLAEAGSTEIELHGMRDGFLPQQWGAVKEEIERVAAFFSPTLILTHTLEDRHQDHRLVAELTWNTFRDHLIWEYEVPKYEADFGTPNLFVPLPRDLADAKVAHLQSAFSSQRDRAWFDPETFHGLMRLRAVACNAPSGRAEAFVCRKMVV